MYVEYGIRIKKKYLGIVRIGEPSRHGDYQPVKTAARTRMNEIFKGASGAFMKAKTVFENLPPRKNLPANTSGR